MKRAIFVALATGAVISSAAALGISAAGSDNPILDRAEYLAGLRALENGREAVARACDASLGIEREICRIEAAALEMVRTAELEARYRRTEQSERAVQRARIDARHQVDRARCGGLNGARRDRCLVQAHATKGLALLEAAAPYEVRF